MPRTSTTIPKKKPYLKLVSKKASFCKGKALKTDVKKAATEYIQSAIAKGKTKAEAEKSANRVLRSGCSLTSSIGARKKAAAVGRKHKRKTTKK